MYYNENTNNRSFLEMSKFLKMVGVKNNMFMLEQKFDGVLPNPYGQQLTDLDKENIKKECRENIWYFLREVVRIPNIINPIPSSFRLNPANMAAIYTLQKGNSVYQYGCRVASGKTISMLVYILWKGYPNTCIKGMNKITTKAILKKMRDLLPSYLKDDKLLPEGKTFHWYDDAEFMSNRQLKSDDFRTDGYNFDNTQIAITTTVGTKRLLEFKLMQEMSIDINAHNIYRDIIPFPIVLLKYNADDLGMTEMWKKEQFKFLGNDQEKYDREIMLKRR